MEAQSLQLIRAVTDTLYYKDVEIMELRNRIDLMIASMSQQSAEIAGRDEKIKELQAFSAALQGQLMDTKDELAVLKMKQVEDAETQTPDLDLKEMHVQTDMLIPLEEISVDHYPLVFLKAAVDKDWLNDRDVTRTHVLNELREILLELSLVDAEFDRISAAKRLQEARFFAAQVQFAESKTQDFVDDLILARHKVALEVEDILAELCQIKEDSYCEIQYHREQEAAAARARKADDEAEKKAARRRELQELLRQSRERAAKEKELAKKAKAKEEAEEAEEASFRKALSASRASALRVTQEAQFFKTAKKIFSLRSNEESDFYFMGEGLPAFLALYVVEWFGSESWRLQNKGEEFRLVMNRKYADDKPVVSYESPYVSGKNIVFWIEHPDFVKDSLALFPYTPVSKDERVSYSIMKAFEEIRVSKSFTTLQLRKADVYDDYGLAKQQITVRGKQVILTVLKLVIWYRLGRITCMATRLDPLASLSQLKEDQLL
jgi:hypothetical protein